jgi:hypothetical protein
MGYDGIPIDSYEKESGVDVSTLTIECTAALMPLRSTPEGVPGAGQVTELSIATEKFTAIIRPLTDDYFMAVVLESTGLPAKARYKMRIAAPAMRKEFG